MTSRTPSGTRSGAPSEPPAAPAPAPRGPAASDPLTATLLHFGLGVREAQLYRALLRHGPSSARQAIHLAGLDRATGYRVLSKLRARGLLSSTPTRPQRFVPLEAARLFDRTAGVLRDDLELLRLLRDHYLAQSNRPGRGADPPAPANGGRPRWPLLHLYPRAEEIGAALVALADGANEELDALLLPPLLVESQRVALARSLSGAVQRGVRVRLVVDYRPIELEFLAALLKPWGTMPPGLDIRFYAPQLSRLFLADRRLALRCVRTAGSPSAGPELGLACDDPEFVRYQAGRFQAIWREALPTQRGPASGPSAVHAPSGGARAHRPLETSRDLRRWVERGALITGRVSRSELAALFGLPPPSRGPGGRLGRGES